MGKLSRRKGAGGEREVCALLTNALGEHITRRLGQARDSGCDIELPPFVVEVKRRKRLGNLHEWMKQATEACEVGDKPVVMCRGDGERWLVVMEFDDWVEIAREEL